VAAAAALAIVYLRGLRGLPPFGDYRGPYGGFATRISLLERHVQNAVSGVNFDLRAFDTLGEEFLLFTSVAGVILLLRLLRGEEQHPEEQPPPVVQAASDATCTLVLALVGLLVLFGIYVVVHGHLSPGGGFQGGVVLATAPLLVFLAGSLDAFSRITSHRLVEVAEAAGPAGYALIGIGAMVSGAAFLENVLPLGQAGSLLSGGTILPVGASVGLEVAGAFVLLLRAFLEEALTHQPRQP
jgi:multicomponent Na+:H+ antiporter subunit B